MRDLAERNWNKEKKLGLRTLLILMGAIGMANLLADYLIGRFQLEIQMAEVLDSVLIVFLILPILGFFVFIPLRNNANQLKQAIDDYIAARDQAEEHEAGFRTIIENNSTAMALIESDQTISYINEEYCKMSGYERSEVIGERWHKLISPKDLDRLLAYNHKRFTNPGDAPEKYEFSYDHKGGEERRGLMSVSLLSNKKIIASIVDITERNRIADQLKAERDRGIDILENMSDAFISLDRNWCYTHMNAKAGEIAERDPREMIGRNIWTEHPEAIGLPFQLSYEKAMNEKVFIRMEEYYAPSGKWYENRINPTENGLAIFHSDITERKKNESELQKAKEKAEESDRLKSAFLANMSHEIRTPMNGIVGFANLLKEPELSGEVQMKYITMIGKSGKRMLNIINDIIDISKIESGQMSVNLATSVINEQLEYVYTFFKPEAEQKGIRLSFKNALSAGKSVIHTDREKVFAILTNLIKNAIKFSDSGTIEFGYIPGENYLQFYVRDNGIGIPAEKQNAIFERFIQADISDNKAYQGAGLGLSITKAYVEMLGGRIWVESEEGKGSVFYFTLPYNTIPEQKSRAQNTIPSKEVLSLDNKLKILIAEDDEIAETLISILVKGIAKEILIVRSGFKVIEACHKNPDIDLILMDIQMPEMSGYQATEKIREFNKEVIIIAQTARGFLGDRQKAIEAGCNDYIAKPIDKVELLALIHKYFKN